jgi:hypothetical protein
MVKFVKPSAFSGCALEKVPYKVGHQQKKDAELLIGEAAHAFIQDKANNKLRDSKIEDFYKNVRLYFETALGYLLEKLPLGDAVLTHAVVADVQRYHEEGADNTAHLGFLLDRYPALLPPDVSRYQILEDLAMFESESKEIVFDATKRVDEVWTEIGCRKGAAGEETYKNLAHVMKGILTIPHSSAHCERIFSCVRKNRTEQRAALGDDTLEALLVLKSKPGSALDEDRRLDEPALKKIKSAYTASLSGY